MAATAQAEASYPPTGEENPPLEIFLVCYDLLPPSHLSSFLNFIGAGVYHTALAINLPQPQPSGRAVKAQAAGGAQEVEYAFGGHDQRGVTGIFSLPVGTADQRMPGLRFHSKTKLGNAFGPEWLHLRAKRRAKANKPKPSTLKKPSHASAQATPPSSSASQRAGTRSPSEATLAPYGAYPSTSTSNASSQITLASESFANKAMDDLSASIKGKDKELPPIQSATEDDESDDDDDGRRDGTIGFTKEQRRAWRMIEEMKRDSDWSGTKYSLLGRNCNSFTDELTFRLTGKRAPNWINRAAWFATSLPCLVPEGWIDEADEIVEDAAAPGSTTTAPVATKPMEHKAQPMHKLGSQAFEEVQF